jgi:hypothetical protein
MTALREAARLALTEIANARDYIWLLNEGGIGVSEEEMLEKIAKAITALRAALAEQIVASDCSNSHQPDAWRTEARNEFGLPVFFCASEVKQAGPGLIPLYTAPPQRRPLTDEEIDEVTNSQWDRLNNKPIYAAHRAYARAIERAHSIGGEE